MGEFVRHWTRLHIHIPPCLFHRTGLDPIQRKATPVSTLMEQETARRGPDKSVEGAPGAWLLPRVTEFVHTRFHIEPNIPLPHSAQRLL
jgi:hypothetical protein